MRTQVFAHRGMIGIRSGLDAEGLLNDPSDTWQVGFVVRADCVDVQPEALELLHQIKPGRDDVGCVDVWKRNNGTVCFSWLGGAKSLIDPNKSDGGLNYAPELLTACDTVVPDIEFCNIVNTRLDKSLGTGSEGSNG